MGAYEEFREQGVFGEHGVRLLYRTVNAVQRIHHFPPPDDYERWTNDAVLEVAHDFLVERAGIARLEQVSKRAHDEASFERLLHQAIRNHFRSRSRSTDFGALMRRVRDVLEADDRFETVPRSKGVPRWTLAASGVSESYTGPIEYLYEAARAVEGVEQVRWVSETRRGPVSTRDSLARIFEAVLVAAGTSLNVQQLTKVTAARFNLLSTPLLLELDDARAVGVGPTTGPAEDVVARDTALKIWSQLTAKERKVFRHLDQPSREAALALGVGHSQVAVAQARIKELLAAELRGEAGGASILQQLELLSVMPGQIHRLAR